MSEIRVDNIRIPLDAPQNNSPLDKFKNNKFVASLLQHRLCIGFAILAALFLANCFAPWVAFVAFPLLGVFMLCDNIQNGLSYIMFALPFCLIYPYVSMIIFLCDIALYAIKFYAIYLFVDKGKLDWKLLAFVALFVIYALLPIGPYNTNTLFKIVIILLVYVSLFAMSKKWDVFRLGQNIKILACSLLLSYLFGAFLFVSPYLQTIISLPKPGSLFRYQALLTNTNVLAMLSELVLAILAYQIVKNKKGLFEGILFGCVAFAGVFTFSKLYFVTLIIILVCFYIGMLTVNWKKTLLVGLIAGTILAVAIVSVYFAKPSFFNSIIARFGDFKGSLDEIMNKFTTSRWSIWKSTFTYWGTNPLFFFFGRGLGANAVPGQVYSAHNAYISMIDQLGVVGAIIFIIPLVILFRNIAKNKDTNISKAIIIPIITIATIFLAEDLFFYINKF